MTDTQYDSIKLALIMVGAVILGLWLLGDRRPVQVAQAPLSLLKLDDGRIVTGLLLREEGEILVMADEQGKEIRYRKDQVTERKTQTTSPMPANFGDQVTEPDLYNLIAYLLTHRVADAPGTGK